MLLRWLLLWWLRFGLRRLLARLRRGSGGSSFGASFNLLLKCCRVYVGDVVGVLRRRLRFILGWGDYLLLGSRILWDLEGYIDGCLWGEGKDGCPQNKEENDNVKGCGNP